MSTPAAVEPPTPENFHIYRAAVLAWRTAAIEERSRHADVRLANPHVPNQAAALAVHELAPEMTFEQAGLLAQKATNWAAQAHHKWFWCGCMSASFCRYA
jgi:arginine exporter protein ArgO